MFRSLPLFLFGLLCTALLFSTPSMAEDTPSFATQLKEWNKQITHIDKSLTSKKKITDETLDEHKHIIRAARTSALDVSAIAKEELKKQQELLDALGEAPEDAAQEDKKVREQRKSIAKDIGAIDSKLKQANLTIAKIDELDSTISSYEQSKITDRLLTRNEIPVSPAAIAAFSVQALDYVSQFDNWFALAGVIAGFVVLLWLARPVANYLNEFFTGNSVMTLLSPFKCVRVMLVFIAAYFVFFLRFNLVDLTQYPAIETSIQATASIFLSVILFIGLGKVEFAHIEERNREILGERQRHYDWLFNSIKRLVRVVLLAVPVLSIAGYNNLGLYLAFNILTTLIACMLFFWLRGLVVHFTCRANRSDDTAEDKKTHRQLSPLMITMIEPVLALLSLLMGLFFWGMTTEDLTTWAERYSSGIHIGDMTIDFTSIGSAIALFAMLYLATRALQWFLSSRVFPYTQLDIGIRDAIQAITGYVGITMAFLLSISAMGLDLSNLAIVAGALSVGIGFGLQAIFSNFVSGLILLFERPVKVGDWVIVGEHEGLIKKISVRSTEIETFLNSSIIVPNSQLISETVTNWTLHDKVGRVDIPVGVAYGTDTALVKEVLLVVAKENPMIRNVPLPQVHFVNFGDSSLDFELRCFVRNMKESRIVQSDLRFAIDKAFREHSIEIPFPQRDLHIVSSTSIPINSGDA